MRLRPLLVTIDEFLSSFSGHGPDYSAPAFLATREVMQHSGSWKEIDDVEIAMLEWYGGYTIAASWNPWATFLSGV